METFSVPSSHRQKTFEMFAAGATLNHPQQPARMDEDQAYLDYLGGGHSPAGLALRNGNTIDMPTLNKPFQVEAQG